MKNTQAFNIQDLPDRYVMSPVAHCGGLYQVSLSKELLDSGNYHTQDRWVDLLQGSDWRLPSGPLMMGVMTALYTARDGAQKTLIAEIQKRLEKDFKDNWMMTGTRIKYTPKGLDKVLHEYRLPEEYSVEAAIVGPDNWMTAASGFEDSIEGLLGTRDLAGLENVSKWASTKKPYLWRVNNKPSSEDVRALVLGVDYKGGFGISASGDIDDCRPVRGVAAQKIFQ